MFCACQRERQSLSPNPENLYSAMVTVVIPDVMLMCASDRCLLVAFTFHRDAPHPEPRSLSLTSRWTRSPRWCPPPPPSNTAPPPSPPTHILNFQLISPFSFQPSLLPAIHLSISLSFFWLLLCCSFSICCHFHPSLYSLRCLFFFSWWCRCSLLGCVVIFYVFVVLSPSRLLFLFSGVERR